MYTTINLQLTSEKMKLILKEMTSLKYRQLEISELEKIYLTLTKMINSTNCHSDFFKDISKTLFVINHYYHINNNRQLLLESLHLCKLNIMDKTHLKNQIDECISIVGNFEIDSNLTLIITNIILITEHYLKTMNEYEITESMFWNFIKTSIHAESFNTSSYYLTISAYLDDMQDSIDTAWLNLFERLTKLLENDFDYMNYSEFIKWYLSK